VKLAILFANSIGFPLLQLSVAWIFVRLPDRWFAARSETTSRAEARIYRTVLRVRAWKDLLPSGGRWVGSGYDPRAASVHSAAGRRRFLLETQRSEAAHWVSLSGTAIFLLWNPPWACVVMLLAGVACNVPCIVVQRYNRAALQRRVSANARA